LSQPGHKFLNLNPFHVLELSEDFTLHDIQFAFAKYCSLLNPTDNTDARAIPLLTTVEKAFEIMTTPDKRDRVQETVVQARDRVEYDIKKKNKERGKKGELLLPTGGPEYDQLVSKMKFKLLAELDERFKRVEMTMERNKEEAKVKKEQMKTKREKDEEWENEREDRVGGWRMFRCQRVRVVFELVLHSDEWHAHALVPNWCRRTSYGVGAYLTCSA
jgi:DnaJ family protein C protein 8